MSTSPNFYCIQNISSKHFTNTHVGVPIPSLRSRSPDLIPTVSFIVSSRQSYSALKLRSVRGKFRAITAVSGSGGDGAGNGNSYGGSGGGDDGTGGFDDDLPLLVPPEYRSRVGGREESLLADEVFLAEGAMECGVDVSFKGQDEYEKLKEKFSRYLGKIFLADVTMAANADFQRVNLPVADANVSLRPRVSAMELQAALGGTSHLLLDRSGDIVVGTIVTNTCINATRAVRNKQEDIPLSKGLRYGGFGLYMALVTNLEYQLLAGGVDPRRVEPFSRQQKLMLSAYCDIQIWVLVHGLVATE